MHIPKCPCISNYLSPTGFYVVPHHQNIVIIFSSIILRTVHYQLLRTSEMINYEYILSPPTLHTGRHTYTCAYNVIKLTIVHGCTIKKYTILTPLHITLIRPKCVIASFSRPVLFAHICHHDLPTSFFSRQLWLEMYQTVFNNV